MDDVQLVTDTYEECWRRSRGRYNTWIDGRLHPLARRFYIVVNATERCLTGGVPSLLEETRFTLAETAEAYDSFGFPHHAAVIRDLAALIANVVPPQEQPNIQRRSTAVSAADTTRLNDSFPMSTAEEDDVWRTLAKVIREHPMEFGGGE